MSGNVEDTENERDTGSAIRPGPGRSARNQEGEGEGEGVLV
jgi:hypothetical protein